MLPIFCGIDKLGTQGIPLHIATSDVEVLIVGDRKTLESALIEVPAAATMVMTAVAKGVSRRDPSQQSSHLPILDRAKNQMPVVGHQRKTKQFDGVFLKSLGQHPNEGLEVFRLVKNFLSLITPIQSMIDLTGTVISILTWH